MIPQRLFANRVLAWASAGVAVLLVALSAGDEAASRLLDNTLLLAALVAAVALPWGAVLAVLLTRTALPGRGFALAVLFSLLFVPLYVHVAAWDSGFGLQGWATRAFWPRAFPPLLDTWRGTVLVHACAAVPWVVLILGLGLRLVDAPSEEAASLEGGLAAMARRITLRQSLPFVAVAAMHVLVTVAGEITVADVFRVNTFAREIYLGFNQEADLIAAPIRFWPAMLIVLALVCGGLGAVQALLPAHGVSGNRAMRAWRLRQGKWPAVVFVTISVLLLAGVPLFNLVRTAGLEISVVDGSPHRVWSLGHLTVVLMEAARGHWRAFVDSGLVGCVSATAAVTLAIPLAWAARHGTAWRRGALLAAATCWALPGPVVGLGVIAMLNDVLQSPRWYDSPLSPCLAATVRVFPLALVMVWYALRSLSAEVFDSAVLEGAGWWRRLCFVALPQRRFALAGAWLAAFAAALGDVAGLKLVSPPGMETVGELIFREIHTGVHDRVAGLCLLAVGVFLVIALGAYAALRRSWPAPESGSELG